MTTRRLNKTDGKNFMQKNDWESLLFPSFNFIGGINNSRIHTLALPFTNKFDLLKKLFSIQANPGLNDAVGQARNPWQKK